MNMETRKKIEEAAREYFLQRPDGAESAWMAFLSGGGVGYSLMESDLRAKDGRIKFLDDALQDMLRTNEGHVSELEALRAENQRLVEALKSAIEFMEFSSDEGKFTYLKGQSSVTVNDFSILLSNWKQALSSAKDETTKQ